MEGGDAVISSPNSKFVEKEEEEEGEERKKEEDILIFLDSLDAYMTLFDSLTSTLRKGWLDLASARHSMGSSRVSSSLLDLKVQSAATTLQVFESTEESQSDVRYTLSKWGSSRDSTEDVGELEKSHTSQLRHRGSSYLSEGPQEESRTNASGTSPHILDNNIQRERSKSLAVFGALVSPKLRSAQASFETALEAVVEIANMRSSMLSAFSRLQNQKVCQIDVQDEPGSLTL